MPPGADIANAIVGFLISAVTIVVVAVPEGLPMAVTLALAYATIQMLKDNNLVRVLAACETMGGATSLPFFKKHFLYSVSLLNHPIAAICSDKTGTLTQNKMTVVKGTISKKSFSSVETLPAFAQSLTNSVVDLILQGIAVNSTAYESKDSLGKKVRRSSFPSPPLAQKAKQMEMADLRWIQDRVCFVGFCDSAERKLHLDS